MSFERQEVRTVNADHDPEFVPDNCKTCKARVILHCAECKVQVTSCRCLVREQLSEELTEHDMRMLEEQSARDRARQKGLIVP